MIYLEAGCSVVYGLRGVLALKTSNENHYNVPIIYLQRLIMPPWCSILTSNNDFTILCGFLIPQSSIEWRSGTQHEFQGYLDFIYGIPIIFL